MNCTSRLQTGILLFFRINNKTKPGKYLICLVNSSQFDIFTSDYLKTTTYSRLIIFDVFFK